MEKNENVISSLFTQKELEELNFSAEELEALEDAELLSRVLDNLPNDEKHYDAFFKKFDEYFPLDKMSTKEVLAKYEELLKKDPKFIEQYISMSVVIDEVSEFPPAKTEKVSLNDIKEQKDTDKIARLKAMLDSIK